MTGVNSTEVVYMKKDNMHDSFVLRDTKIRQTFLPLKRFRLLLASIRLRHRRSLDLNRLLAVSAHVTAPRDPWVVLPLLALVLGDAVLLLHGQADVVETVDQTVFPELLDVELAELLAVGRLDHLVGEVDFNLVAGFGLLEDLVESRLVCDGERKHAVLEGVVEENVSEAGGDDALDAKVEQSPWSVLSAATTSKVVSRDDEDLGCLLYTSPSPRD